MGLEKTDAGIVVDRNGRTSVEGVYAVGRGTKIHRSQAIISAGEGAAAALDILSIVHGKDFNDFDVPPKDD
jgi:thioredoxin reductase